MTQQEIIIDYRQRLEHARERSAYYRRQSNLYSLYRLILFGLFIGCVVLAATIDRTWVFFLALLGLVAGFSWLVNKQNGFDKQMNYWLDAEKVTNNELSSIDAYGNIYSDGVAFSDDKHFYTSDLDIFGPKSLFNLLNRAATDAGINKLANWLRAPADGKVITERQEAVKEIAAKNDFRLQTQAFLAFCIGQSGNEVYNLIRYLEMPPCISGNRLLKFYIKATPWLILLLAAASWFYLPARYILALTALVNLMVVAAKAKAIKSADLLGDRIGKTMSHFADAFAGIETGNWQSGYLKALHRRIKPAENDSLSKRVKQLSVLIDKLNYQLNFLVGAMLNMTALWSLKQTIAIEDWKIRNQSGIETAFDVLAELEALMSLSSLAVNYPDWSFPEISGDAGYTLAAKGLGHPLIGSSKRVNNDYGMTDTHRIDIITGSNMAGKSTFLRTIGINTVMALCGAPVCAIEMKVSVVTVITYMRIKDSLNESTSTFKAEIDRLQMLLQAVESEPKVFFLIDEMLRGTNSADKYLGSKAVIERLISKNGVGMVATHDLQIAGLEQEYPGYIHNFYFDIQVENGEMLFDYKLKPGECKTFNASLLLKRIGIDVKSD